MNIMLLFGGKSCEHDVSIITAGITQPILKKIGKVFNIYVDGQNAWWLLDNDDILSCKNIQLKKTRKAFLTSGDNFLKSYRKFGLVKNLAKIDVAVPCFHGVNGEDGSVSGLLQLSNIPYTCGNTFACGASMDKIATKTVLKGIGARVLPAVIFKSSTDSSAVKSAKKLGFPLVIKPANLGSSIGIKLVYNEAELSEALRVAFSFDNRVIAERALLDFYEVNCSAMRVDGRVETSDIERPVPKDKILTFADKYCDGAKKGADRIFPYDFDFSSYVNIWTKRIYNAFNFDGVIRIDFLVNNVNGEVFVNEVNAIPGSLAYYLWQKKYNHTEFLSILIDQAIKKQRKLHELTYAYQSNILSNAIGCKLSS